MSEFEPRQPTDFQGPLGMLSDSAKTATTGVNIDDRPK